MKREKHITTKATVKLFNEIKKLHKELDDAFIYEYNRSLPLNETILDRWDRAHKLGFGKDTSLYDSSFVFGNPKVGNNCWIGPNTIIDGSGGLEIGDYCTISVGVQIYSHDNIKQTLSSGKIPIERADVKIGNNVYIGPNAVITKGVKIGSYCIIGAYSLVNKSIPDYSIVFGQPGVVKGTILIQNGEIKLNYNNLKK